MEVNGRQAVPDVSFIIPSFESRRTIGFTLRSILDLQTSYSLEVIVVDSSNPPVTKWIRTKFPSVRIIHSLERLYPGAARNEGVREARAELLAFVDADTTLQEDWLDTLVTALSSDGRIQVAGGSVSNANPASIASKIQHWIEFSEFLPRSKSGDRPFISSSNFVMRKKDFNDAGGFSDVDAMAEDLEFFQSLPGRIFFEASTGIAHHHRSRWGQMTSHMRKLGFWSGKLRARRRIKGSWIRRLPSLSLVLPFYRYWLILLRVTLSDWRHGLQCLLAGPAVLLALGWWALGFRQGLSAGKATHRDSLP